MEGDFVFFTVKEIQYSIGSDEKKYYHKIAWVEKTVRPQAAYTTGCTPEREMIRNYRIRRGILWR